MLNIAVLVSGGGTNLQALLDSEARGENPNGKIKLVVASKPGVYALERAAKAGVEGVVVRRKDYAASEDFDAALLAAQNGKSDMVMAGVTVTDERLKVMDFSDTYAEGIQSIIVKEDSDIASVDDLAGKKIGTQRGTTGYLYCSDDFGDENVVAYDDGLTAVQMLNNGQVDCVVIDNAPAKEFIAANPGLKLLDTAYVEESYAIGIGKGNTELKDAINTALEELKADGTLQAIVDKYITAE